MPKVGHGRPAGAWLHGAREWRKGKDRVRTGGVMVAGKALACHHCGHASFEVRPYYLTSMLLVGGAVGIMCTSCHFVHTFRQRADVHVTP